MPFSTVLALAAMVLVRDTILESKVAWAFLRADAEAAVAAAVAALRPAVAAAWASARFWRASPNFWEASVVSLAISRAFSAFCLLMASTSAWSFSRRALVSWKAASLFSSMILRRAPRARASAA